MNQTRAELFDLLPDMVCVLNYRGIFVETNSKWEEILGWLTSDLSAKAFINWVHIEDQNVARNAIQSLKEAQEPVYFACRFKHKDGSHHSVYFSGARDDKAESFLLTARDKTQVDLERANLLKAKVQLEVVFSSMREGVIVFGPSGEVLQYNRAALQILGVTIEQLEGKTSFDPDWHVIDEAGKPIDGNDLPAPTAQRTGKPQMRTIGVHQQNGQLRWTSSTADPLFFDDSKIPSQVVITFHDVTDQKLAQEEVRKKEHEVSRVLNSVSSQISYWNRDLRNVLANKAYADLFDLRREDIQGMHIKDVIGDEIFRTSSKYMIAALNGEANSFERSFPHPRGHELQIIVSYTPDFKDGEVLGFFIVVTDITRIKVLEQEQRLFESKFVSASKMSSLGEMAAGIAHEINNPLAIINGKTSLLQTRIEKGLYEPVKFMSDLSSINDTVERIAKTVRGLLAFSRNTESEGVTKNDLHSIIEGTLDLCREKMRNRGIQLRMTLGPVVEVECRANQISQILMNLLNNAWDAIAAADQQWVAIRVDSDVENVLVTITDSGVPILPDVAEKMMNPFFTTKELGKGTGLGLSISKGLAESHGGTLTYSVDNNHTSFVLALPRAAQRVETYLDRGIKNFQRAESKKER